MRVNEANGSQLDFNIKLHKHKPTVSKQMKCVIIFKKYII